MGSVVNYEVDLHHGLLGLEACARHASLNVTATRLSGLESLCATVLVLLVLAAGLRESRTSIPSRRPVDRDPPYRFGDDEEACFNGFKTLGVFMPDRDFAVKVAQWDRQTTLQIEAYIA